MSKLNITPGDVLSFLLISIFFAILPLLVVSRIDWTPGWIYAALTFLSIVGSHLLVARKNPGILAERARSFEASDAKTWDKYLMLMVGLIGPILVLLVSSLDVRFGWSPDLDESINILGLIILIFGLLFSTWAFLENKFFSGIVRIQTDRGHYVITSGPYRLIRHPGYAGAMWMYLGIPFYFGSIWGLIPAFALMILFVLRTSLEDKTLQKELPGYNNYIQSTKYRLLPLIW